MNKEKMIDQLFKVLPLFEANNKLGFEKYLTRITNEFSGLDDNEYLDSIIANLKGIKANHESFTHEEVKSIVFHMISLVKKA
ncbi:MAG: hypothetical protein ACRCX8_15740 [Sarcina sp.]